MLPPWRWIFVPSIPHFRDVALHPSSWNGGSSKQSNGGISRRSPRPQVWEGMSIRNLDSNNGVLKYNTNLTRISLIASHRRICLCELAVFRSNKLANRWDRDHIFPLWLSRNALSDPQVLEGRRPGSRETDAGGANFQKLRCPRVAFTAPQGGWGQALEKILISLQVSPWV